MNKVLIRNFGPDAINVIDARGFTSMGADTSAEFQTPLLVSDAAGSAAADAEPPVPEPAPSTSVTTDELNESDALNAAADAPQAPTLDEVI